MVYVRAIKPADAGFNQFQQASDGVSLPDFDTAEQYVEHVVANNSLVTAGAYDADVAEMGDEDGQKLAAAIRKATGAVQGGHHEIVAFLVGDEVQLESVEEVEENEFERVDIDADDSKADLRAVWFAIDTPIYLSVDETGYNAENCKVRRLNRHFWLSIDDVCGVEVLTNSEVRELILIKDENAVEAK